MDVELCGVVEDLGGCYWGFIGIQLAEANRRIGELLINIPSYFALIAMYDPESNPFFKLPS